jgi:RNA polymerase sigma factor (sigma-70 family)
MVTEQDEALALAAQQGNKQAFAALVDRYKSRVYQTLYQVVGNDEDAQDLAQEVFLKVYRSLSGYRGDAAFSTWLHRVALNLAFDWLRARKRRPLQVPLETPVGSGERRQMEITSHREGPEEQAIRKERHMHLHQAVQHLTTEYREVVVLYHIHQLSYQEIAERLGCPVRTVETRLYRARGLLRQWLTHEEGGEVNDVHRRATLAGPVFGSGAAG